MPGLVVIEEPDTALNPGILHNFVEQLRIYTEGDAPRQFILTTHNPRFLDYFRPEEVRVVSRDENGYTTVSHIPDHISEVWLEDHTLGEVWMTRSLGGLPE
jgi:predicted ATPase